MADQQVVVLPPKQTPDNPEVWPKNEQVSKETGTREEGKADYSLNVQELQENHTNRETGPQHKAPQLCEASWKLLRWHMSILFQLISGDMCHSTTTSTKSEQATPQHAQHAGKAMRHWTTSSGHVLSGFHLVTLFS